MFTGPCLLALLSFLLFIPSWAIAQQPASAEPQSLADTARKLRKDKPADIKMTDVDAKELFKSVDKVLDFASEDTGFVRRSAVKKSIVGQADIEKFTKDRLARADFSQ